MVEWKILPIGNLEKAGEKVLKVFARNMSNGEFSIGFERETLAEVIEKKGDKKSYSYEMLGRLTQNGYEVDEEAMMKRGSLWSRLVQLANGNYIMLIKEPQKKDSK